MYLGNPLLPINVTALSATESLKKELAKKNWHEYELKPLKLNLVPYFLFNYHYFMEDHTNESRTIKSTVHGILAIDGHKIEVRPDLVETLKNNWKKAGQEIPQKDFNEKWCNIEKREMDDILKIKTAKEFNVPKNNVFVSSAKKMFVPFYYTSAILNKKEYKFIINAIDGTIEGFNTFPERQKGHIEITRETINDLKNPINWIKYLKEAITDGASILSTHAKTVVTSKGILQQPHKKQLTSLFESRTFLIALMILAIILIIISISRI